MSLCKSTFFSHSKHSEINLTLSEIALGRHFSFFSLAESILASYLIFHCIAFQAEGNFKTKCVFRPESPLYISDFKEHSIVAYEEGVASQSSIYFSCEKVTHEYRCHEVAVG